MSIEVTCLQCGSSHQVNDRLAGRRVRCPECETAVHVPELDAGTESTQVESTSSEPDIVPPLPVEPVPVDEVAFAPLKTEPTHSEPVSAGLAITQPLTSQSLAPAMAVTSGLAADTVTASSLAIQGDDDEDGEVLVKSKLPEEEIDMTPMVDVTFLLLIFFMVTAAFSLQKSIQMPRQQTEAPSTQTVEIEQDELDQVEVQVDEYGSFLVMAPDWERETPGKQNLISALRDAIAGNKDGMKLIVKVHEMAKLRALVEAMDAGTIAGYAELEVTQVEEFD